MRPAILRREQDGLDHHIMKRSRIRAAAIPRADLRKARALAPRLINWFAHHARDLPWRRTRNPYAIWVSEIMLQQTQVNTVIPYYERWINALPTVQSLARASSQRLHKLWEGLGYYTRVRNMHKAARVICKENNGRFPDQFDNVLALPGIGRYTAGAICSIAFNQPTPILDGNVIRVLTRVFGIGTDPKETETNAHLWQLAQALVSIARKGGRKSNIVNLKWAVPPCSALNQSLMELGATICTPRNPHCLDCPVRRSCMARRNGLIEHLPVAKARPKTIQKRVQAFVILHRNRYLAVQRPKGEVNTGLWEFPSVDANGINGAGKNRPSQVAGIHPRHPQLLGTIRHSITRYQITVEVYRAEATQPIPAGDRRRRWLTVEELTRLPLSAAHRRIVETLLAPRRKRPRRAVD